MYRILSGPAAARTAARLGAVAVLIAAIGLLGVTVSTAHPKASIKKEPFGKPRTALPSTATR